MKRILLLFSLFLFSFSHAQFNCFNNPSLEGTPMATAIPPQWTICSGIGDIQPGFWGIVIPPSNGNSYVSLLRAGNVSNGYYEGIGQALNSCLIAGVQFTFTVDLAHTNYYSTAGPNGCYSSLEVWGGNTSCALTELLWVSPNFYDSTWRQFTVNFTPSSNWCYLTMRPGFTNPCGSGTGYINVLVDHLSCINTAQYGVNVSGTNVSCYNYCNGTATANAYSGNQPYTYLWTPGNFTTQSISNLCPGTYSVVVTDNSSATVGASVTITQPSQQPFAVTVPSTISCNAYCNGTATANVVGGTPGFTYNWMPSGDSTITAYGLCPGTYTLIVTDANGCTTTDTGTVAQMPPITASITFNGDTLCTSSAYSYQWIYNSQPIGGATDQCYYPDSIFGQYNVIIYDSLGCAASASVDYVLGLNEWDEDHTIHIFPNPAADQVDIQVHETAELRILDLVGKELSIQHLQKGVNRIEIKNLAKGIYLFKVQRDNDKVHVIRVVKQ